MKKEAKNVMTVLHLVSRVCKVGGASRERFLKVPNGGGFEGTTSTAPRRERILKAPRAPRLGESAKGKPRLRTAQGKGAARAKMEGAGNGKFPIQSLYKI